MHALEKGAVHMDAGKVPEKRDKGSRVDTGRYCCMHACTSREVMVCFLLSALRGQRIKAAYAVQVALRLSSRQNGAEAHQWRAHSAGTA